MRKGNLQISSVVGVSLLGLVVLAGCSCSSTNSSSTNNSNMAQTKSSTPSPNQQMYSDTMITTKVKSELALNDYTKASSISVETVDGVVTLSGVVDTAQGATTAVELAAATKGVKAVNTDNLSVRNSNTPMADSYITAKIKGSFVGEKVHDIHFPVSHIKVSTRDGVVYLDGKVQNKEQEDRAVAIAKSIDGVTDVVDRLAIQK